MHHPLSDSGALHNRQTSHLDVTAANCRHTISEMPRTSQFTKPEVQDQLVALVAQGHDPSSAAVANQLGVHRSTITRAIDRSPILAKRVIAARRRASRKQKVQASREARRVTEALLKRDNLTAADRPEHLPRYSDGRTQSEHGRPNLLEPHQRIHDRESFTAEAPGMPSAAETRDWPNPYRSRLLGGGRLGFSKADHIDWLNQRDEVRAAGRYFELRLRDDHGVEIGHQLCN